LRQEEFRERPVLPPKWPPKKGGSLKKQNKTKQNKKTALAGERERKNKRMLARHPASWSSEQHYGQCGQSCPCCRASVEPTSLGTCAICRPGKKRRREFTTEIRASKRTRHDDAHDRTRAPL
jgi:hypothetical protein